MSFYLKYCHRTEKRWHLWWESNSGPPVQPTEPTGTLKFQDCHHPCKGVKAGMRVPEIGEAFKSHTHHSSIRERQEMDARLREDSPRFQSKLRTKLFLGVR